MPATGSTKSKLLEQLRGIQRGKISPFGFGFGRASEDAKLVSPTFMVIASVPTGQAALARAALDAGAHAIAIEIDGDTKATDTGIADLVDAAGDRPIGAVIGPEIAISSDAITALADAGADFVVISPEHAPIELLKMEKLCRIVRASTSLTAPLLRALGELDVDVVAAVPDQVEGRARGLSLLSLMHYRQVVGMVHQPTVVVAEEDLSPVALQELRDIGFLGVVLPSRVVGESADAVRDAVKLYREAADKVTRPVPKRQNDTPILPRVSSPRPFSDEEPEPEVEPDEDDE